MAEFLNDPRFAHIPKDPKFRKIPKKEKKVVIDKRFNKMFTDEKFGQKYSVDKRGRPMVQSSTADLKKLYDLSSSEDEDDHDETVDEIDEEITVKSESLKSKKKKKNSAEDIINSISQPEVEKESDTDEEESIVKPPLLKKKQKSKNDDIESDTTVKSSKRNKQKRGITNKDTDESHVSDIKKDKIHIKQKLKDLTVDYARGEGVLFSESSSDEDTTTDEEEEDVVVDHNWGELDKEAETTDEVTSRLAACNMDWDKIRAVDLMVVFNSFVPSGGYVKSVTIYPSEFGMQRMQEEEISGPKELVDSKHKQSSETDSQADCQQFGNDVKDDETDESDEEQSDKDVSEDESTQSNEDLLPTESTQVDDDNDEEGSEYHMEKMRQYQLNRLKYYYAVIVFDSPATANAVYTECDGFEYETTATKFDLRFIPDDMEFDQEPKEICDKLPDLPKYQPRQFTTTALQQVKVELTWDETKPERLEMMQKLNSGKLDDINQGDLQAYVACGSSDEESDSKEDNKNDSESEADDNADPEKYRAIFKDILEKKEEKKKDDIGLEFTWGLGTKERAEKLLKESMKKKDLTPFEQYVEKRKEKIKEKRNQRKKLSKDPTEASDSDESIPPDVDMNDPYFAEEFKNTKSKKDKSKHKKSTNHHDNDEEAINKAELELLLLDEENQDDKRHFNMKSIEEGELLTKSKKKRLSKKKKEQKEAVAEDNFEVNVEDPRFAAVFTSHHFNIDPADPRYRKTKGTEALVKEKLKRRANKDIEEDIIKAPKKGKTDGGLSSDLAALVKSVKMNVRNRSNQ